VVDAVVLRARARVGLLAALALGIEWGRVLLARRPDLALAALLAGGLALCALGAGHRPAALGVGADRLPARVLGGLALAAVLLLPAAARGESGLGLGLPWAFAAVAVSVGEEVAFRGALFASLEAVGGGAVAVLGTTLLWTAAHALSHPPAFLVAVAAAGLLLGVWRWVFRDLLAPTLGHVLADLALAAP
jgi:membrane protease YdiL (CAAX protease family)